MRDGQHIRVAVNGYGVIGKRVAAAVVRQDDMSLAGVSDVVTDWRARMAPRNGLRLFGASDEHVNGMRAAGLDVAGTLDDLLGQAESSWTAHPNGSPPGTSTCTGGAA
jgi:glyceraldehyde-3-phosphate dehydrogenase (NAD(P))